MLVLLPRAQEAPHQSSLSSNPSVQRSGSEARHEAKRGPATVTSYPSFRFVPRWLVGLPPAVRGLLWRAEWGNVKAETWLAGAICFCPVRLADRQVQGPSMPWQAIHPSR